MPKYVIERDVPGAGTASDEQLQYDARESNAVLRDLGPDIQWLESFVTDDKIYCVYIAESADVIREHARCLDIPASRISPVRAVNDPSNAA
jgi:hypothetical protein